MPIFRDGDTAPANGSLPVTAQAVATRPSDFVTEVAMGLRDGYSIGNKFGFNADIDTGGPEIIASFGDTFSVMTTASTLDISSTSANDASGGTGATLLLIQGIDSDSEFQEEFIAPNGTSTVTTANTYLGVNRVYVVSSGSLEQNDGDITLDSTSGGFGTQAMVPAGSSVTQQCILHTRINESFLLDFLNLSSIKISGGGGQPEIIVHGYSYSRVTNTRYEVVRLKMDTQRENNIDILYKNPIAFGGREVIYFTAETDTNNTSVSLRFSGILHKTS
jgi:hypothetical protein